jgi:hypothetical protein
MARVERWIADVSQTLRTTQNGKRHSYWMLVESIRTARGSRHRHVQGNALDLWALARQLPLYEAALDLAETFHLQLQRSREEATRNPELATR